MIMYSDNDREKTAETASHIARDCLPALCECLT